MEHHELRFGQTFLYSVGGILIGFALYDLVGLIPFTLLDKIILLGCGGILLFFAGHSLVNRDYKEFLKNLLWFLIPLILLIIVRIYF